MVVIRLNQKLVVLDAVNFWSAGFFRCASNQVHMMSTSLVHNRWPKLAKAVRKRIIYSCMGVYVFAGSTITEKGIQKQLYSQVK